MRYMRCRIVQLVFKYLLQLRLVSRRYTAGAPRARGRLQSFAPITEIWHGYDRSNSQTSSIMRSMATSLDSSTYGVRVARRKSGLLLLLAVSSTRQKTDGDKLIRLPFRVRYSSCSPCLNVLGTFFKDRSPVV